MNKNFELQKLCSTLALYDICTLAQYLALRQFIFDVLAFNDLLVHRMSHSSIQVIDNSYKSTH